MKLFLSSLALASVAAVGLASTASASPGAPIPATVAFDGYGHHHHGHGHGRSGFGFGIGISTGGPRYAEPAGYYVTQYRWVPTTVFAGYDAYRNPVYTTQYVQQPYQVWVPTGYYAQPRTTVGFGLGYRFR